MASKCASKGALAVAVAGTFGGWILFSWRRRRRKQTLCTSDAGVGHLKVINVRHEKCSSTTQFSSNDRIVERTVVCSDAFDWIAQHTTFPGSVITSIPDVTELSYLRMRLDTYLEWFTETVRMILSRLPADSVAIFYQTDFRRDGKWVDKSLLCSLAARDVGAKLLFHKIVCIAPPDSAEPARPRPRYSHLLAYSRDLSDDMRESTADVLSDRGHMPWERAMGVRACTLACEYVRRRTPQGQRAVVVDPFCGHGTILAVANMLGMDAIGVEKSKERCRIARNLLLNDVLPSDTMS
eukprot:TRINITY_DN18447_c0_g1_i1.p1 TRINITY_DN18447_c0_g1~~TRINITY_DN18447_c0_g1_i1.p1  ORF type:complete len:320 (-),score=40.34 TRINITY_DN18447_c0_g1_i1:36-920(-)